MGQLCSVLSEWFLAPGKIWPIQIPVLRGRSKGALHSCQLQTSVPPSTKREEKVDLFQFMLDMLIILW